MATNKKIDELRTEFLKDMLEEFQRTRSIAKAVEICDWLADKI